MLCEVGTISKLTVTSKNVSRASGSVFHHSTLHDGVHLVGGSSWSHVPFEWSLPSISSYDRLWSGTHIAV